MAFYRVLIFGASITYGAWDTEGGWVDRLKRDANRQMVTPSANKLQIFNLGIAGDTSAEVLKRMDNETSARKSAGWDLAFVFSFGSNDGRSENGKARVSIEKFESNLNEIIGIASKYSKKILFVAPPPIGKPIVLIAPPSTGKEYEFSDDRAKMYEERMKRTAEAAKLPFVQLRSAFEESGLKKLYSFDSLHPNDAGHKLIYKIVRPKLEEFLFI